MSETTGLVSDREPRVVRTRYGDLGLVPIEAPLLDRAALWPGGLRPAAAEDEPLFEIGSGRRDAPLGVLIGCGYYADPREAAKVFPFFRLMLPFVLAELASHPFRGVILPAACMQVGAGCGRLGYALLGRCERHAAVGFDWGRPLSSYERALGAGGTSLLMTFVACIAGGWKKAGHAGPPIEGFDVTSWAGCGSIAPDLMFVDGKLICLAPRMLDGDPMAGALVRAEQTSVVHLPALAVSPA